VQDVTFYSKGALFDAFKTWRDGGPSCSGRFDAKGQWKSTLTTRTPSYAQAGKKVTGVERVVDTKVFEGNEWGLEWSKSGAGPMGVFPQYFREDGDERVAIGAADVPPATGLRAKEFRLAGPGSAYTSPKTGAWANPGPRRGPLTAMLADGSVVTYWWYRFVDQPSLQQHAWSDEKKARVQRLVEGLHAGWGIDAPCMAPPSKGELVSLDRALLVIPPRGLEVGYVPIVTAQSGH
jgi:hypothetical protein